ncbi:unnamed protein product [Orchesella dallaii]|uniref:C2H2-type domain-containing protein n=1 Tax=Orchesella dallaii TaxID=48710 RepID=A0ABP1RFB1_9HEXA
MSNDVDRIAMANTEERLKVVEDSVRVMIERFQFLEGKIEVVDRSHQVWKDKFGVVDGNFEVIEGKYQLHEEKFRTLEGKCRTLEVNDEMMSKRVFLLEQYIDEMFREPFRDFVIRRSTFWDGGGGDRFHDGFNPRGNRRQDSFEGHEDAFNHFDQRENGIRRHSFNTRSSSSNASYRNVASASNKRTKVSKGSTSALRKRARLSVSNSTTYQRRQPSIEYGTPVVIPAIDVDETATSSNHTNLQIFNEETPEQHGNENGSSVSGMVLDTTSPDNTTEQLRSADRIETDSAFENIHNSGNLSDKSSSGPEECAATTAFAAVDMTHVTAAKEIMAATTVPFKNVKEETEGTQVPLKASSSTAACSNLNTPTNVKDTSLQLEKNVPATPPLQTTPDNVTTVIPVVIDLTITGPSATPLKSTQQLPIPTLGSPVVTQLNVKLSTSTCTADTKSSERKDTDIAPLEIDMIAATNNSDSVPVGSLTETESLTVAPSFTLPLESLSINNNPSLSAPSCDFVIPADAVNTTTADVAAVNLENSINDAINPPDISVSFNSSSELNSPSGNALQSDESMYMEASSEDSDSHAGSSTSSDSDELEVRHNSFRRNTNEGENEKLTNAQLTHNGIRISGKLPRKTLKPGAPTEADVITLSSDSESNDKASTPPKPKQSKPLAIVLVDKKKENNPAGSAALFNRLSKYSGLRAPKQLPNKLSTLRNYDILGEKCSPSASRNDIAVNGSSPVPAHRQLSSVTRGSKPIRPSVRFLQLRRSSPPFERRLSNRTKQQPEPHSSRPISSISNSLPHTEPCTTENELEDYDADLIEIVNECSSVESAMAGKSSRVSGKVVAIASQSKTVNPTVSRKGENGRSNVAAASLQDQGTVANVEVNSNAHSADMNTTPENEANQLCSSVGVGGLSPSDMNMNSCHQVRNDTSTSIVISRKPPSSKPSPTISAAAAITIDASTPYDQRDPSASNSMDILEVPEKDVGAISPERLPPPLIRIDDEDRTDEVGEQEDEGPDNESSKDQVDDEPTMPILSVSGSQISPSSEKTSVQDQMRTDEGEGQLQQLHLICDDGESTFNGEPHDSDTVNGKKRSDVHLNHYMVDSLIPFIDDGSDRKCKRKTIRCKSCETSFQTQKELEEHMVDEHDDIDSEYDSQAQEDPSYNGRLKHKQPRSVRSKKSSLSNRSKAFGEDTESESEQLPVKRGTNINVRHSAQEQSVICPYCKHTLSRNHRRAHIRSTRCTISEDQLNLELRSRRKIDWEPATDNPNYETWKVPIRQSRSDSKVNENENDDVVSNDVSYGKTGQENVTFDLDNESNQSVSTNAEVVHAGPSTSGLKIAERQVSGVSSSIVRKEDGVNGRFAASHYKGSKLRKIRIGHNSRTSKLAADSSNSFDSDNSHPTKRARSLPDESVGRMVAVHRGSQSTVSEFDHDQVGDIFSHSPGVDDDFEELEEQRGGAIMETDERENFQSFEGRSNLNQSAMTELVSEYEDESSATEEFRGDGEPSKLKGGSGGDAADRKSGGAETATCPACGKCLLQRNLQRHSINACPALRTPKKKQPRLDVSKLVCKYEDCAYIPSNNAEYREHLVLHPRDVGIACKHRGCGKVFIEKLNLEDHTKTHQINVPYDATGVSVKKSKRLQPVVRIIRLPNTCQKHTL